MHLTWVEAAFRSLKSGLYIRPIYHQLQSRVEAHILVAFVGYALLAVLRRKTVGSRPRPHASGGAGDDERDPDGGRVHPHDRWPTAVFDPEPVEGIMPRHTELEPRHEMPLERLGLTLAKSPPQRMGRGATAGERRMS